MRRIPRLLALAVAVLVAGGCPSGAGGSSGTSADAVAASRARWQVLDLRSGAVRPAEALPDLASDPAYRQHLLAFRRIEASGRVGQPAGTLARQPDEMVQAGAADCYIAAFELTREQWSRLTGGGQPWLALQPAAVAFADAGGDVPALGVSWQDAQAMLAAWNTGHAARLGLPSAVQWEVAARAGSQGLFPWGDDPRQGAAAWTAAWETVAAPQPVGGRLANAWGLYDVVGNAAELDAEGIARGGAWCDPVAFCRLANRLPLEPDTRHAGVGLRLLYRP